MRVSAIWWETMQLLLLQAEPQWRQQENDILGYFIYQQFEYFGLKAQYLRMQEKLSASSREHHQKYGCYVLRFKL